MENTNKKATDAVKALDIDDIEAAMERALSIRYGGKGNIPGGEIARQAVKYVLGNLFYKGQAGADWTAPAEWIDRSHPNFTPSIYADVPTEKALAEVATRKAGICHVCGKPIKVGTENIATGKKTCMGCRMDQLAGSEENIVSSLLKKYTPERIKELISEY